MTSGGPQRAARQNARQEAGQASIRGPDVELVLAGGSGFRGGLHQHLVRAAAGANRSGRGLPGGRDGHLPARQWTRLPNRFRPGTPGNCNSYQFERSQHVLVCQSRTVSTDIAVARDRLLDLSQFGDRSYRSAVVYCGLSFSAGRGIVAGEDVFQHPADRQPDAAVAANSTCGMTQIMQGAPIMVLHPTISGALVLLRRRVADHRWRAAAQHCRQLQQRHRRAVRLQRVIDTSRVVRTLRVPTSAPMEVRIRPRARRRAATAPTAIPD